MGKIDPTQSTLGIAIRVLENIMKFRRLIMGLLLCSAVPLPLSAAPSAQHYLCSMTDFIRIDAMGKHARPLADFYMIQEETTVTIGIVGKFEVFSDWVFTINWEKGKKLTATHPDGSFSFDGTIAQLVSPQPVSGISAIRATCTPYDS